MLTTWPGTAVVSLQRLHEDLKHLLEIDGIVEDAEDIESQGLAEQSIIEPPIKQPAAHRDDRGGSGGLPAEDLQELHPAGQSMRVVRLGSIRIGLIAEREGEIDHRHVDRGDLDLPNRLIDGADGDGAYPLGFEQAWQMLRPYLPTIGEQDIHPVIAVTRSNHVQPHILPCPNRKPGAALKIATPRRHF